MYMYVSGLHAHICLFPHSDNRVYVCPHSVAVKREHEEREMLQAKLTDRERELKEVQEQLEALKKSDMEVLPTHTVCMSSDPHKHSHLSVCVRICFETT